jgi:hypothetical protein
MAYISSLCQLLASDNLWCRYGEAEKLKIFLLQTRCFVLNTNIFGCEYYCCPGKDEQKARVTPFVFC